MTDKPFQRLRQLFAELKRRKVYRVAAVYAAVAFIVLQVANLVFPALNIPSWAYSLIVVLALLGFPLAVVLAWAFEVTPEGVRRTPEAEPVGETQEGTAGTPTGYKVLVGFGLIAAAVAGGWYLTGGGGEPAADAARLGNRSIAVLPFEALGQEEPGPFTEGMHDDLLSRLSNVSGLKVISRTSVQQYRETDKTTAKIAEELGVRWVLEGGVQEMGEEIQVNAQLIDPRSDTHAWAESYRRDLSAENLFDLQSEITQLIVRSLEAELTSGERDRMKRQPTEDLEAYRLYAQGRRLLLSRASDSLRRAIDRFERAIARDSTYALAWSGLSDARALYASHSPSAETWIDSMRASLPEAEEAAERALELDPNLAEAHASRALLYMYEQWLPERGSRGPIALRHLRRAVELKPSYAQAHSWLGEILLDMGRPEQALKHVRLAVELNPDNYNAQLVLHVALLANGRYEEALRQAERLQDPGRKLPALAHLKRWKEVRSVVRELRSETDDPPGGTTFFSALAGIATGDTAMVRERIEKLRARGTGEDRIAKANQFDAALLHAALGELDLAFKRLEETKTWPYPDPEPAYAIRYFYPDLLSSFRQDPRYKDLIRELNEYWGLNPDGSLPDSVDVSFGTESDD